MIVVENLVYEYADKRALDHVSFQIPAGEITALVGPNGAGKTTLLRCIAALARPLSGKIEVNGSDVELFPRETHKNIGYLSDSFGLYDDLTAEQAIRFAAHARIPEAPIAEQLALETIQSLGIQEFNKKKINTLSRGMKQRVGIAQAIVHRPKLVMLDEPASGLDPEARYALSSLLVQLKDSGMSLIVSSHILAELEDYSTDMLVIREGKIVEHKKLGHQKTLQGTDMCLTLAAWPSQPLDYLGSIEGIVLGEVDANAKKIYFKLDEAKIQKSEFLKRLLLAGWEVEELSKQAVNLQDEYIKTVSKN
ncbi:MAG: ABC transporter ATP-binding protein [Cytophagales bacterium]|nr:ABC transporter ATP-binding protein [Cytophagales bacterium]